MDGRKTGLLDETSEMGERKVVGLMVVVMMIVVIGSNRMRMWNTCKPL